MKKAINKTILKMAGYIARKNPNCTHCDFKKECKKDKLCEECIIDIFERRRK